MIQFRHRHHINAWLIKTHRQTSTVDGMNMSYDFNKFILARERGILEWLPISCSNA